MRKEISVGEFARLFVQTLLDESQRDVKGMKAQVRGRAAAVADLLHRHFGLSRVEFLGNGAYGAAARTPDGRAIKLTTDEREVDAGVLLAGKDLPHVARIESSAMTPVEVYNGTEERDLAVGIIVLEALDRTGFQNKKAESDLNALVAEVSGIYKVSLFDVRNLPEEEAMKRLEGASKQLLIELEGSRYAEFREMAEGLKELHKIKLWAVDLHYQNVGWSDREQVYKLFDLGLWPKQVRPVLKGLRY